MEKLRDEILQCENARSALLKWKLAVVGAVGAAGLGLSGSTRVPHAVFVLCVIPPVAVYVDLLCRHLTLKMLVIGTYLDQWRGGSDPAHVYSGYESWARKARKLDAPKTGSWKTLLPKEWESLRPPSRRWKEFKGLLEVHFVGRKPGSVGAFDLEDWALSISTVVLSVALLGAFVAYWIHKGGGTGFWLGSLFLLSGAAGLAASAIGNRQYIRRVGVDERLLSWSRSQTSLSSTMLCSVAG